MKEVLLKNLHLWLTALLSFALIPTLLRLGIPPKFDWYTLLLGWVNLSLQSIFLSTLLYLISFPPKQTLMPACAHLYHRFSNNKVKLLLLLLVIVATIWRTGFPQSIVRIVALLAIVEAISRFQENQRSCSKLALAVFLPGVYLFLGFVLVFAYNNIIASVRFYGTYDVTFNQLDAWLLNGRTVADISHRAQALLHPRVFRFLEFIYFGMFPQIGASIIIAGIYYGKRRALQLVGTILTAYYLALVCYYLWPSLGPFYICLKHFLEFPSDLETYFIQKQLLTNLQLLWVHKFKQQIGTDYFIAFPCMHIVQPLIVMWFLRRWKRIMAFLYLYSLLLLPSIVLLEWHYIVDLLGGAIIACLAIAMVGTELEGKRASKSVELVSA